METVQEIVIEPKKRLQRFWKELWEFRELFFFLSWRNFLIRYKQTVFGVAWSVIRPVLTMIVFTVIFGKVAKLPAGEVPYPILVYAAVLPWQYFATTFSESSMSVVQSANLVSKVYFPRVLIPSTPVFVNFVDFLISFTILFLMMLWFEIWPTPRLLILPLLLLLAVALALGAGFFVSALNVRYRDFRFIVPFVVQFGLYISPVGFSSAVIPEKYRLLFSLNPMVGVIEGFRWAILGKTYTVYLPGFLLSILITLLLFVFGLLFFLKMEREFADVI
jgi:lipopolysaccharide transport system permease protein